MVDGLPANIGIGIVLPIRSSSVATGVPVLPCTGTAPVAVGAAEWRIPSKMFVNRKYEVDCQKRFPVVQTDSMCQVASVCRGLA